MERTRVIRAARLSAAAVCLLLSAAFVVVCIHSYSEQYCAQRAFSNANMLLVLGPGRVSGFIQSHTVSEPWEHVWQFDYACVDEWKLKSLANAPGPHFSLPLWLPTLVTGMLAAALGIRRPYRFSLRSLLLAMTFVSILLGVFVLANR
jgi:hypothetical protein